MLAQFAVLWWLCEAEISTSLTFKHDPFQLRVLFQLSQAPQLERAQPAVLLLPAVEGGDLLP